MNKTIRYSLLTAYFYVLMRLVFHSFIVKTGYVDVGLINYDSYYHFAFANELHRSGNLLFFHNPFGSLDALPHLFNLYATLLELVRPLYEKSLFLFDVFVGAFATYISAYFLLKLMPKWSHFIAIGMLFGGGIGNIIALIFPSWQSSAHSVTFWGLNFLSNQLATPELVYHAFFFWGTWALFNERKIAVFFVAVILAFLHPFTSITFGVVLMSYCFFELINKKRLQPYLPYIIACIITTIFSPLLFNVLLPSTSLDASFFKKQYYNTPFTFDSFSYVASLSIPVFLSIFSFALIKNIKTIQSKKTLFVFGSTSLFCIIMSLNLVPFLIPQPAHWSRVYPFVFLFGIATIMIESVPKNKKMIVQTVVIVLVVISLFDNMLLLKTASSSILNDPSPPELLTHEQDLVLTLLSSEKAGKTLYLRSCRNGKYVGHFEYVLMSKTLQTAEFGHRYFSPFINEWTKVVFPCNFNYKVPPQILAHFNYLIFDTDLRGKMSFPKGAILFKGHDLTLLKQK